MPKRRDETYVSRDYSYRRDLSLTEMLPAIGAGVMVGAAAFYVARILLQRTPLVPGSLEPVERIEPRRRRSDRAFRAAEKRASGG
jgi:hypothetical protein